MAISYTCNGVNADMRLFWQFVLTKRNTTSSRSLHERNTLLSGKPYFFVLQSNKFGGLMLASELAKVIASWHF